MENVVLTVHLILAVLLTGVVLLQRSEGGGLGLGGGGVMTGRQAASALTRLTWIFGVALFVTSIALTIIAARQVSNSSIMDQLGVPAGQQRQDSQIPQAPAYVPPPATGSSTGDPLTPPAPEAPATGGTAASATEGSAPPRTTTPADQPAVQPDTPPAAQPDTPDQPAPSGPAAAATDPSADAPAN